MTEPSKELIDICVGLAEGRVDLDDWLQWWESHAESVQQSVPPGWFTRLKPRGFGGTAQHGIIESSQTGACYILDQLKVAYVRSDRYEVQSRKENETHRLAWDEQQAKVKNDPKYSALVARFQNLGAEDPEGWAFSEISEDIPQLARFVFLRELWKLVIPNVGVRELGRFAGEHDPKNGTPLQRLKTQKASLKDVAAIVREAQCELVKEVVFLIDQAHDLGEELDDIRWGLFELDEEYRPTRQMDGLHESVDDDKFSQ